MAAFTSSAGLYGPQAVQGERCHAGDHEQVTHIASCVELQPVAQPGEVVEIFARTMLMLGEPRGPQCLGDRLPHGRGVDQPRDVPSLRDVGHDDLYSVMLALIKGASRSPTKS